MNETQLLLTGGIALQSVAYYFFYEQAEKKLCNTLNLNICSR